MKKDKEGGYLVVGVTALFLWKIGVKKIWLSALRSSGQIVSELGLEGGLEVIKTRNS